MAKRGTTEVQIGYCPGCQQPIRAKIEFGIQTSTNTVSAAGSLFTLQLTPDIQRVEIEHHCKIEEKTDE